MEQNQARRTVTAALIVAVVTFVIFGGLSLLVLDGPFGWRAGASIVIGLTAGGLGFLIRRVAPTGTSGGGGSGDGGGSGGFSWGGGGDGGGCGDGSGGGDGGGGG